MDQELRIEARDTREGGFYWVQQELLYVFTPLIGVEASWLYQTLCQLIPQAVHNPAMVLSLRTIARVSGMSKSSVDRKLKVLIKIGMVREIPGGFELPSLRKLAAVGAGELEKRLAVPQRDTPTKGDEGSAAANQGTKAAQGGSERGVSHGAGAKISGTTPNAPEASDDEGVPQRDSIGPLAAAADEDTLLSQKEGVSVPENGGDCPKNPGSLSQNEPLLIKEKISDQREDSPLPPEGDGGLVLPREDVALSDPDFPAALLLATAWLMDRCAISDQRQAPTISKALELRMRLNRETLRVVTELAARNFASYQGYLAQGLLRIQFGIPKFFGHGHWQFPDTWPFDEAKLREHQRRSSAGVGMYRE